MQVNELTCHQSDRPPKLLIDFPTWSCHQTAWRPIFLSLFRSRDECEIVEVSRKKTKRAKPAKIFRRRTSTASAPGTVTSDSQESGVRLRQIHYTAEHLSETELTEVCKIANAATQTGVLWVDLIGVGNGPVIEQLGHRFKLHPLALEDVVHTHQRSKCDDYEDRLYFVVRMLRDSEVLDSEQVSLFLGPNFVISIQEREGDCLDPIRERLRQHARIRSRGADYLFYAIIDAILDGYFPRLEAYGVRLEELEEGILNREDRIEEIYSLNRELMWVRKHLWQHREAVHSLLQQEHELIRHETQIFLRDCYDHLIQMIDVCETFREHCANLRDLHLSTVSMKANEVMKMLTIFATIFMPMSFVAGVYGMNFDHRKSEWNMPETEWTFGYPFALTLMAVIGLGLLGYFWKKGWLGN